VIASTLGIVASQNKLIKEQDFGGADLYRQEEKKTQIVLQSQKVLPSLGFENLIADWTYLQFVQYFGDSPARDEIGYGLTADYFHNIVDKDPRFLQALLVLSGANTIFALNPKTTVELLNKALESIDPHLSPLSPYIWSYKGVDEMLFLGDNKEAQKSYEMAAKWAEARGGEDDLVVAKRNAETAAFLAKNPDSKKARVAAWISIMENALNDEVRGQAIQEIQALGGTVEITKSGELMIVFPEQD
jgi:hypothetical protein